MGSVNESVVIRQPVGEVWRFITDIEEWTRVKGEELRTVGQVPLAKGVTVVEDEKFFGWGPRIHVESLVTDFVPERLIRYSFTVGPGKNAWVQYTLEPVAEGTRFTASSEYDLTGWLRRLEPLFARRVPGNVRKELAGYKTHLESPTAAPHAMS